jgi:hypothetical protein
MLRVAAQEASIKVSGKVKVGGSTPLSFLIKHFGDA